MASAPLSYNNLLTIIYDQIPAWIDKSTEIINLYIDVLSQLKEKNPDWIDKSIKIINQYIDVLIQLNNDEKHQKRINQYNDVLVKLNEWKRLNQERINNIVIGNRTTPADWQIVIP